MAEALAPPDLIAGSRTVLASLVAVPVVSEPPNPRPDKFVVLRDVGGAGRSSVVVYRSTLTIEGWALTEPDARDLCHLARAHFLALKGTVVGDLSFYDVRDLAAPGSLPDPLSGSPRYTATVEVALREIPV